ncbi:MAG: YajQ family cyclic di-GMP-binding protein, partial [Hyphomicrobiales bacterium]|nr:YajQ family cyclic di-GMP-binding protein [Hyphomicrobiales bacterium]
NGVDQANREVTTRFDFKGSGSSFELSDQLISMNTESDFQLQQMYDMLCNKLVRRGIEIACLEKGEPVIQARTATQSIKVIEGIETPIAKNLVKMIKQSKTRVQAAIQGEQLRITGKKRDDLQAVIALLKGADVKTPLQYKNFRD